MSFLQSHLIGCSTRNNAINQIRYERLYERGLSLNHVQHVQLTRQLDAHLLAIADDVHTLCLRDVAIEVGREVLESTLVSTYQNVTILEAVALGLLVELHTLCHVLYRHIAVTPIEQDHRIDKQGQQEVDEYTTNHNQQSLPGWLGTKLPRLCRTLHLLRIEALVNHTRYLAIATKGYPAQTIFGIAILGFILEQTEFPVKEHVEFLYSDAKQLGKEEVAALMQQNQNG